MFFSKDRRFCTSVEQGGLGNCYFMASISAVAVYFHRIERLLISHKANKGTKLPKDGAHCVALNVDGAWDGIILDNNFPYYSNSKNLSFGRSSRNTKDAKEIWVMLLEKAFAKISGGYGQLRSGLSKEGLGLLTGAPCKTFVHQNTSPEELLKILRKGVQKAYPIVTPTIGEDDEEAKKKGFIIEEDKNGKKRIKGSKFKDLQKLRIF